MKYYKEVNKINLHCSYEDKMLLFIIENHNKLMDSYEEGDEYATYIS